ncbi:MAG: flagellar L-ring protein [Gemmatimonadetes bacterium]|nr:flagellar L-ring protein [Gemmatimonadota bacterium]
MKLYFKFVFSIICLVLSAPMLLAQSKDKEQAPAPTRHLMSWTADRREYQVGDIITVLVSEATLATATKSQSGSDQQTRKNDMGLAAPKIGPLATLPAIDGNMSAGKNSSSKQSGDASRATKFQGDITVRVVAVDKSGQLQLKGVKVVDVDKNKQTLNFTGWVRPDDITRDNLVQSERVADASMTYQLSGDIGKTRGGIIGRLLTVFWP